MLNNLYSALATNKLDNFNKWSELKELLIKILKDDRDKSFHNDKEFKTFYDILSTRYRYFGIAYHGFVTMCDLEVILKQYSGITSFTPDIEQAFNFASNIDSFLNTSYIIEKFIKGVNFGRFLTDIRDIRKDSEFDFLDKFLQEKEILTTTNCRIGKFINTKGKTLEQIKEEIKFPRFSEEDKKDLELFIDGMSDSYLLYQLESEGKLDRYKIDLYDYCYRGLVSSDKVFKNGYMRIPYGSFSMSYNVAYNFANELIEDDVHNVVLRVSNKDIYYAIDVCKLLISFSENIDILDIASNEDEVFIKYKSYNIEELNKEMNLF